MSELAAGVAGPTFSSLTPFPDDHDVLSFLTYSLREPGPEVMSALGPPRGKAGERPHSPSPGTPPPDASAHVMVPSDLPFQPLSLPAL